MTTTGILLLAILILGFLITFQIAKASEYVSVLKGEKKAFEQNNRINAFLMVVFLVLGLIGVWWCNKALYPKTLMPYPAASEHGKNIDTMLMITIAITGIVFLITQILLFWFAYKYQHSEKRQAFFYPHNNKLEVLWTTVPAIALCILVGFGLFYWFRMTGEAPADAMQVEITGKQFGWIYRYPGKDGEFGKKYYRNIDEATGNQLGLIWRDTTIIKKDRHNNPVGEAKLKADPQGFDDLVDNTAMYLVKGKAVKLIINSRDVIHDVGLSHFRLKMDAVPGTPTTMWFTPQYTTDEMKKITNNPKFEYEISCDQMCGNSHYAMRGIIKVVTPEEFILWKAKQKPAYALAFPETVATLAQPAAPVADSAASTQRHP
ncbi:cytochrome c oxidase subunit II [Paraflavitalea sp. CAU 1676]|uniref:cytochrome c oxidase subunit II n=1 Tax=Paraflavitalea sp. CAU 1676 TaxID=3032598 RepID=UPI0023DB1EC1|nr:cytochrome c oxidase subunit II [Paraflavitalea sp. CAU 1676]MDF2190905.1 cytochrome c oxidase subunit II [Paraflavitalea sp. CAU 1676]